MAIRQCVALILVLFLYSMPSYSNGLIDKLYESVEKGNVTDLNNLIEKKVNVNEINKTGDPVLLRALLLNRYEIAGLLLRAGAEPNARDKYGNTLLTKVAMFAPKDSLKILLRHGANGDLQEKKREMTPLHVAIEFGNYQHVREIVESGVNLNLVDSKKETPLYALVRQGNYEQTKYLLEQGANPNVKNYKGRTAIGQAVAEGRRELVELLLKFRADPNLGGVSQRPLELAYLYGRLDIANKVIEYGGDVNVKDRRGNALLIVSSSSGNESQVDLLVKNGANINITGEGGYTALMAAAKKGHYSVVKMLASNGANAKALDQDGKNSVYWARKNNYPKIVKILEGLK